MQFEMYHEISDRDKTLFEAGIKLGALLHQFTGMPINLSTVSSTEKAIEESVKLQPYVIDVSVTIDSKKVAELLNTFGYCELRPEMLKVKVKVKFKSTTVIAGLRYDYERKYPLMYIERIAESVNG